MSFRDELDAANAKYLDAMGRGDAEELASLFVEDAVRVVSGRPIVKGRQAIRDDLREVIGDGLRATVNVVDAREFGDLACVAGTFDGGERSGKYMAVSQRQSDGTRLLLSQCIVLD